VTQTDGNAIAIKGLGFRYPGHDFYLEIGQWSVPVGARVAVMGPSGCGKSTLLELLAGVLPADAGSLQVCGRELRGLADADRRRHRLEKIGFIYQDFPLLSYLTVKENVLLPYRVNPAIRLNAEAADRCARLLEILEIDALAKRKPEQLSQGERQRVAIARALVTKPELLLADEPTAGLDPKRSDALMALLEKTAKQQGLTLVIVSHDRRICEGLDHTLDLGAPA
jgi:putative ABC transport system ATP-binding protein